MNTQTQGVSEENKQVAKELASKARELWKLREDEAKAKAAIDSGIKRSKPIRVGQISTESLPTHITT